MRNPLFLFAIGAVALVVTSAVQAMPGDVVVPAHRTKDGQWVPANVPPLSGGTHLARRPGRGSSQRVTRVESHTGRLLPPLLVDAQNVRR
jgi:hypothetical protein